jgi:AAA family ATP:ADP antiporter
MVRTIEDKIVGDMTDHERSVLRHGAAWFFLVLFSYYILRPIREQISATYGIRNLQWLFMATFGTMLIAIPLFAFLVSKVHRRKLVPSIYGFFCLCLAGFWAAFRFVPETAMLGATPAREWVARILFIWISVYGLFIVSFFWSVIGDMLSTEQGRRLFGFVAGGGTAGGMVASAITTGLVQRMGQANLLLLPAVALGVGLTVYLGLERSHSRLAPNLSSRTSGKATGGNPFSGFTAVFSSRYLLAIGGYGLLLATCGTTIYFQQSEIVKEAFADDESKTAFFANVNLWVQVVTIVLQTAVVGRLMKHLGLGITLAILPLAYALGITSLASAPTIAVLAIISVTGRSAEYAIANPAREVLFTAVDREDRYKAKSFIDTIVRRGGDSIVGYAYRSLREVLGMAMTTLSWAVLPIAAAWIGLAVFIGKENKKITANQHNSTDTHSRLIDN